MSPLSPTEQLRRQRVESLIALAAPFLDAVLSVGDRVSRVLGPEDEYYPIRAPGEAFELPTRSSAGPPAGD